MHPHLLKFSHQHPNHSLATLKNLFIFLAALIQAKTVNLYNLKDEVGKISEKHQSKSQSHYRRLTRFFVKESQSPLWISVLRHGHSLLKTDKKIFYLDATEWSIGRFKLHCLVLAFDYRNIAVPVYFQLYNHKGVLSEQERIGFIKSAHEFIDLTHVTLIADREFIGHEWFGYLADACIDFVIRIRKNQYKNNTEKSHDTLEKKALKNKKVCTPVTLEKHGFWLWIAPNNNRSQSEPLIYILTNLAQDQKAVELYGLRWKIESLFKHLKTNGYNLQDLRMTSLFKIRLLVSIVILAYILSVLSADKECTGNQILIKRYKNKTVYRAISVFKQGQSVLKQAFATLRQFLEIIQSIGFPVDCLVT